MIELRAASKIFDSAGRSVTAVDGVDLQVEAGETLCLIGPSGSGKTTVLKLINRLVEPSAGQVLVDGEDIAGVDVIRLRRRMGYVIQSGGLFPHRSVAENVGLLCELEGWSKRKRRERVEQLLELVNLPAAEYAHRRPRELSGGQQQRVGIARALALDPPIVLMDEPFGALDPITRAQLHEEFLGIEAAVRQTTRKTIVLVTHDLNEAFKLGDRVALLDQGRLAQVGSEETLRTRPASDFVRRFVGSLAGGGDDA